MEHRTEEQEDTAGSTGRAERRDAAHLRVLLGPSERSCYEVRGSGTTLGRSGCDICIDDGQMSRAHAKLALEPAGWRLHDLGSSNGAYVDGVRIGGRHSSSKGSTALHDGAVIRLGGAVMVFRISPFEPDSLGDTAAFPGVSPGAVAVRARIAKLSGADGPVLILGETGAGKERVARAMANGRPNGPFIPVNCAELREALAPSVLFGHVRGAFSGAVETKSGLVDAAEGGVLFLDEVGELHAEIQGALLRFIEDGTYRQVGSTKLLHSTARLVAATNVDLYNAPDDSFRRDLLARLHSRNAIELPPLRDRREDIPMWARLFLAEAGHHASDPIWTAGALECLLLHPWTDNLRGLRREVCSIADEETTYPIRSERLPKHLRERRESLRSTASATPQADPTRTEIEQALATTGGNVVAAAKHLNISRDKLYRLFRRLNMDIRR